MTLNTQNMCVPFFLIWDSKEVMRHQQFYKPGTIHGEET